MAGQIWGDTELFGAPVAEAIEERDQCLARRAEGIGDSGRRGAHYPSADDAISFQFPELGGENLFTDASKQIAEFGEAQRAKGKAPDCLDFPLAAKGVDRRLNGTAVMDLHGTLQAYKFVRTSPQQSAVIPCPRSIRLTRVSPNFTSLPEPP